MIIFRPVLYLLRLIVVSCILALSQIWMHKVRSLLTTIGITIGVASVTAVIAALTGLESNVTGSFEKSVGSNKIHMNPFSEPTKTGERPIYKSFTMENFEGLYERCPSVRHLCRSYQSSGPIQSKSERVDRGSIIGVDTSWHEVNSRMVSIGRNLTDLDNERNRRVCILDESLRDRLKLDIDCMNETLYLRGQPFLIVGILPEQKKERMFSDRGRQEYNLYIPLQTALAVFPDQGYISAVATSKHTTLTEDACAELRFFLRRTRDIKPGAPDNFKVYSMGHFIDEFKSVAAVITAVAAAIVGISLLVGGIGVMNVMLASVSERTREIGLRKAVGARPTEIMFQFLIESVTLCVMGGLLGLLAAKGLTMLMAYIPKAKLNNPDIPLWAIGLSLGFTSLVGLIFGLFPAIKAARLDPIKALRHE